MELAPVTEPWTAAVPWARRWQRPGPQRRDVVAQADARRVRPPRADPALEIAWTIAVIELTAARLRLAESAAADDPWVEAMAGHAVHLAARQVRALQAQLGDPGEPLHWTTL